MDNQDVTILFEGFTNHELATIQETFSKDNLNIDYETLSEFKGEEDGDENENVLYEPTAIILTVAVVVLAGLFVLTVWLLKRRKGFEYEETVIEKKDGTKITTTRIKRSEEQAPSVATINAIKDIFKIKPEWLEAIEVLIPLLKTNGDEHEGKN